MPTESSMVDQVREMTNDVMRSVDLLPPTLRDQVSLLAGMALGFSVRVQNLERLKVATRNYVRAAPNTPPDVIDDLREAMVEALRATN